MSQILSLDVVGKNLEEVGMDVLFLLLFAGFIAAAMERNR
jgi:hypothetical protein